MRLLKLAFVAALAWLITAPASAQIVTLPTFVINNDETTGTNFPASTLLLDARKQQNICIEWTFRLDDSDLQNVSIRFVPQVAGGVRATSPQIFSLVAPANGTTPVRVVTNFTVRGFSALEIDYGTNGNPFFATNTIRYSVKANAP